MATQNLSVKMEANIPPTSNNFMDEADFEELLQDEILAGDDIFSNDDLLEAMEPSGTNLHEKEAKSKDCKVSSLVQGCALQPKGMYFEADMEKRVIIACNTNLG